MNIYASGDKAHSIPRLLLQLMAVYRVAVALAGMVWYGNLWRATNSGSKNIVFPGSAVDNGCFKGGFCNVS